MPINGIRLLAHRGGRVTSAENTLESITRARAEGADGVELDVQLSADGEPFIFHDDSAERTTGRDLLVGEASWSRLQDLRVFGKHAIPHLDDVLEAFEAWPKGRLILDLHQETFRLAETVARRVGRSPARDRITILGFFSQRGVLLRAGETDSRIHMALMPELPWNIEASTRIGVGEICLGWADGWSRTLYRLACRFYDIRKRILAARRCGVMVSGGIANTPEDVRYMLGHGVDGIWTDDIVMAREVLLGEKRDPLAPFCSAHQESSSSS